MFADNLSRSFKMQVTVRRSQQRLDSGKTTRRPKGSVVVSRGHKSAPLVVGDLREQRGGVAGHLTRMNHG